MPDRPVDLLADAGLVVDREAGVTGASLLGLDPAELDFGPDGQGEIARDHVIIEDHGYYDAAGSEILINTGDPGDPGDGEIVVETPISGFPQQAYFFGDGAPPPYDLPQETGPTVIKEAFFSAPGHGGPTVPGPGEQFGTGAGDHASPAGPTPHDAPEAGAGFSSPVELGFVAVTESESIQVDVPDLRDEDPMPTPIEVGTLAEVGRDDPVGFDLGFPA